jgi:GH24 family phage-related lysozyme (muramidase)
MKSMILSYEGKCLIRKFEKCYLTAHQREPSLWEIGYGWTDVLNGVQIHEGSTISQEVAEKLLTKKINLIEIRKLISN